MTDRFRVLQIIWLALMGGVVTFAGVAYVLLTVMDLEMPGLPPLVLRVVGPAAVVMMAGALLVRRKLLDAIPAGSGSDERLGRYQAAVITSLALIEGPGLLIIVLSLVSGVPSWIPAGAAVTLLMMVLARPRREELGDAGV
jgi:hypothetical protein